MKKILMGFVVVISTFFIGCVSAPKAPLSQMQIREMTVKEIQSDAKTVFKATMTILQDQGYIIQNTDFNSGLIVAEKEANKETTAGDVLTVLFVDPKHRRTAVVKISATISEVSDKVSKLRLNIQEKEHEESSHGTGKNTTTNIQDKEIYTSLFNAIRTEVERIKASR